jgi:glycosyltransferase involved in cell wall biosynthesis
VPAHGGAEKANRMLAEGLTTKGHVCRVVARAYAERSPEARDYCLDQLAMRGIQVLMSSPDVAVFSHAGVEVHAVTDVLHLRKYVERQVQEFEPTWILLSSGGVTQTLLGFALKTSLARVIYLVHSLPELPFGPYSTLVDPAYTELLRQTAGLVTTTHFLKEYIQQGSDIEATILPIVPFGCGPFPYLGHFDNRFVTLINPCASKGLVIFLSLARSLPDVQFAAVPTWGTTSEDRAALECLPNVQLLQPVDDMDEIFAQTRVLLFPSLVTEGFGMIVVEAMLRGIPVLASDVGGVSEAKLGVDYLLPVRPIERYEERLNERRHPIPVVPEQEIGPWLKALQALLSNRAHYEQLSKASRDAALAFVKQRGGIEQIEEFLQHLSLNQAKSQDPRTSESSHLIDNLTPEKRALLALRLKKKTSGG